MVSHDHFLFLGELLLMLEKAVEVTVAHDV